MKTTFYFLFTLLIIFSSCTKDSFQVTDNAKVKEVTSYEPISEVLDSNKDSAKSGESGEISRNQQEVLTAIQLGLIELATEDKFINIIRELSELAGQDEQYTFSTQSIVAVYNMDGDDLLEKVYQSALMYSENNEEVAQLARNSFESYEDDGETRFPVIVNPFVLDDYPLSEEYANWDGVSPQYVATAFDVEGSAVFGHSLTTSDYFISEVTELGYTPGWFLSDDSTPAPDPAIERLIKIGKCPWDCYEAQGCYRTNSGPICEVKIFGITFMSGGCMLCHATY